jgi:outer membrane protein OmpA-like peptidoglycan-associated protein
MSPSSGSPGTGRDRFNWDAPRHGGRGGGRDDVAVRDNDDGGWNRNAMRSYKFRQTAQGAMLTMQEDVLFATDRADLRPARSRS